MRLTLRVLAGCLALGAAFAARADLGGDLAEHAMKGRFDLIEQRMEGKELASLATPELHALCYAYSKTKRYNRLTPCLEQLARAIQKGPRHTRLFGLDDATPSLLLMRATAALELAQRKDAVADARTLIDWIERERSADDDMRVEALAILSIASTQAGDRAAGERYAVQLAATKVDSDYASIKAMAAARAWSALGQYDKALAAIRADKAFEVRAFIDNLVSGASLRGTSNWVWAELPRGFLVAHALLETGDAAQAKTQLDKLLAAPATPANADIHWLMLMDRARIAEREGQLEEAIRYYRDAITVIEEQRASINTEAAKIGFVGDKQGVYANAIGLMLRAGQPELAFEYAERSKARALVDLLASKQQFAAPAGNEQAVYGALAQLPAATSEALVQLPLEGTRGGDTRAGSKLKQVRAQLSSLSPELASLVSVTAINAREVRSALGGNEAVLEFYGHGDQLYALTVTAAGVKAHKLDAKGLDDEVRQFRKDIEERGKNVQAQARALYDRLIRPLEAELSSREILIIPHGVLHYVAFGALHDGKDYWLATRNLRYLPSASVVKFLKPARGKTLDDMLVIGNPDLNDARLDLPSAELEAKAINAMAGRAQLLVRKAASETAFRKQAPGYRYLHVASHGEYVAETPLQSRLLLAPDGQNDGSLTTDEIYTLRLNADLVTLSACETALGTILSGDDVVGLTRGFVYAGASNVVSTLWQVDDDATTFLMQRFYTALKSGQSKREALRAAQLETMKKKPHPFFWAAFLLTGTGS